MKEKEKKNSKKIWKKEFVNILSDELWISKKEINLFFEAFVTVLVRLLTEWKEVKFSDLWKFYLSYRKERFWIDPTNPEKKIKLPWIVELKFTQSKTIKDYLNNEKRKEKIMKIIKE